MGVTVDVLTDVLDFNSEDIDCMDDDAGEEQEPPPTGRWTATSSYDIYIWWTRPKKAMAMRQWWIFPLRSNLSTGVIGAALSPVRAKIAIPAQIAIRMVPKTKTIPPSQASSRPNRTMSNLGLRNSH